LYKQTKTSKTPVKVTQQTSAYRYADGEPSKVDNFFFCIREDHSSGDVPADVVNTLVAINATNGNETVIVSRITILTFLYARILCTRNLYVRTDAFPLIFQINSCLFFINFMQSTIIQSIHFFFT